MILLVLLYFMMVVTFSLYEFMMSLCWFNLVNGKLYANFCPLWNFCLIQFMKEVEQKRDITLQFIREENDLINGMIF